MPLTKSQDYQKFLISLKKRIKEAQYTALKAVNKELINLYWDIGKQIAEKQVKLGWGKSIVENLAKDLQVEFYGVRGFSERNLRYMLSFYNEYKDNIKLQPLVAELGWTHNILILSHSEDIQEREFYIRMAIKHAWSKYDLQRNLKQDFYKRWLLNQQNFDQSIDKERLIEASLAVKDDYNFDFLNLDSSPSEKDLEKALINNIVKFLKEMGGDFAFVGKQYKLELDDEEFFIDLLFYHRRLKSLVAIELKTGEFQPEYAGKMQFYLSVLDDKVKLTEENPSIGIIICKNKSRTKVEYTLKDVKRPIGVASYNQYQSLEDLPEKIAKYLPGEDELSLRLGSI